MKEVKDLIRATGGKIFTVEFVKKNGDLRKLNGRIGVKRDVTGRGMSYDPEEKGLLVVRDVKKRAYRMVNLATVFRVRCWGEEFVFGDTPANKA